MNYKEKHKQDSRKGLRYTLDFHFPLIRRNSGEKEISKRGCLERLIDIFQGVRITC